VDGHDRVAAAPHADDRRLPFLVGVLARLLRRRLDERARVVVALEFGVVAGTDRFDRVVERRRRADQLVGQRTRIARDLLELAEEVVRRRMTETLIASVFAQRAQEPTVALFGAETADERS